MYPNEPPQNSSSVLLDPHRGMGMKPLESAVPNIGVVNDEELGQDWLQTEEDLQRHERPKRAVRCPFDFQLHFSNSKRFHPTSNLVTATDIAICTLTSWTASEARWPDNLATVTLSRGHFITGTLKHKKDSLSHTKGTLSLFQNRTKSLFFPAKSVFQIFFLVRSLLLFASNQFCASSHYYKSSQAAHFSGQVSITFSICTIISKPSHIIISKPSHINISRPSHIIISKPSHILVLLQFQNVVASLFLNMVTLKFQN